MSPREREKALQEVSKDLPAHYREIIESYFRRLGSDRPSGWQEGR
jgi:hypothetical protein